MLGMPQIKFLASSGETKEEGSRESPLVGVHTSSRVLYTNSGNQILMFMLFPIPMPQHRCDLS